MRTEQRETGGTVIEGGRFPHGIRMARQTIMRELSGDVIRDRHSIKIGKMT
jgi:hypothetical protein